VKRLNALEIQDLQKVFRGKKGARVQALKGLSLSVRQGEVFGFLGPNGAGKTTTIKILMGLIRPSSGTAMIMGYDTGAALSRNHVGYLPENPSFYDFLTGAEYIRFVSRMFGRHMEQGSLRTEEVLKLLDLWEARNRPMRGYSKGMIQRLGLAQALVHDPDVYILDEPMSGLDPVGRALVKNIIRDLKSRGKSVFFSTHITADVEAICDRVGIVVQGNLCKTEDVGALLIEGVVGYDVRIQLPDAGDEVERYVSKEELPVFMKESSDAGMKVVFIEPKRRDLEAFFLNIVKEHKC
jgi:ABC-2 type transport system ATP-binding protein